MIVFIVFYCIPFKATRAVNILLIPTSAHPPLVLLQKENYHYPHNQGDRS